jgi:competence protein ComFC
MKILRTCLELKNSLLDFVFPPHCLLCNRLISPEEGKSDGIRPAGLVCQDCWKSLNVLPHPFCPTCRTFINQSTRRCPKCSESSSLNMNRSLGLFDPDYQTLLHHFKYKRKISLGKELGKRLGELLIQDEFSKDYAYLMPVPLHSSRERERGYNQSKILAEEISELTLLPLLDKVLKRKKNTRDQTNLNAEERERNVRGAFIVRDKLVLKGKRIILVDDVMTTGATLKECSRVLKEAGAKEVTGTTVAAVNF